MDKAVRVGVVLLVAAAVACGKLNSTTVDEPGVSEPVARCCPAKAIHRTSC
jgi:hypothetical protein